MPTVPTYTQTPSPTHTSPTNPCSRLHIPTPNTLPPTNSPSCGSPRSPSPAILAPSLTSHPTVARGCLPPKTDTLKLVSPLHILPHTHPPHFLALASLSAPEKLSPTSPRSSPHPQTPSPRHGSLPASSPEAQPGHVGQAPPLPPLMPDPGRRLPRRWEPPRKGSEEDDAVPAVRLLLAAPGALG